MYSKILIPLDGTEAAEKAIPNVLELASYNNAEVHLLYVASNPAIGYAWDYPVIATTNFIEMEENARRYIEKIRDKIAQKGVKVSAEVCDGAVAPAIIDVAEKENVDLIAMYTHARKGLSRLLMGSFTEEVIHDSPIPVLVVH